jgi:hypothetical protein
MGRILPFYRTGGVVSGGGGGNTGIPLGPFNDWSELPASAQDGAFADVLDLGPTSSTGVALYNAGAGQWQLQFGYFETLADLNAFTDPKALTAVAAVGPLLNDPESVRYQWDDPNVQWLRTPDTVPYAWTLTETQLLTGADPSGIGALQDGDYGTYTPAGGAPVVVRYKAACTVAVAAGGGTRAAWISPDAYAAATPTIQGYLLGSEDPTARGLQGWTDVLSAAGTRSITGNEGGSGETLLLAEFSGGSIASAQLACGVSAIVAGTKVWWGAVLRGDTTGTSESAVRFAGDGTNFNWLQQQNVGGTVRLTNSAGTTIDGSQIPGGTGTAWPGVSSTADVVFGSDTGSAAVSRVSRNGAAYTAGRRPAATSVQNNALRFATGAVVASSRGRLRVSYVIVVTY